MIILIGLHLLKLCMKNVLDSISYYSLFHRYFLNPLEAGIGLQHYNCLDTVLGNICPVPPECDRYSKYRTFDGSCNNLAVTKLGQSLTPLLRLLPPDYADG